MVVATTVTITTPNIARADTIAITANVVLFIYIVERRLLFKAFWGKSPKGDNF